MTDKTAELREAKEFDTWFEKMLQQGGLLKKDRYVAFQCFVNLRERLSAPAVGEGWKITSSESLARAWERYTNNFGEAPRGTMNQLRALFELIPTSKPPPAQGDVELLERLAAIEHDQWIEWSQTILNTESISKDRATRWNRWAISYQDLPEDVKELGRKWARKVLVALATERKP